MTMAFARIYERERAGSNFVVKTDCLVVGLVKKSVIGLVGGKSSNEGNVIAVNSKGYMGPICDDVWDFEEVCTVENR